ncbi:hypothetical protein CKO38_01880 [Rhodospirillum rubrum]|uniref:TSUP family transporter n=1 Tax=Rhodospirillum rubrum TaxID=1085 RepID=UPI00190511EE|nr:TSUP family transporter [Rhodospirillum rubrum]MBK1663995.1 hypothetical protein [Rhodospirillum rubrum]MBK1675447.1 hypothetical protein [Rhodospirillum rubrum]
MDPLDLTFLVVVFLVAGLVKGLLGLGLPLIAMGLMSLRLPPAEAAALVVVPSLVTNIWQMVVGPHLRMLIGRLTPMIAGIALGTWIGALVIGTAAHKAGGAASALVGLLLALYALYGLVGLPLPNPVRVPWRLTWGLGSGLLTGLLTAATGVFTLPTVPYLQSLRLERDALIQALGLAFTVSTLALAARLAGSGPLSADLGLSSLIALIAALSGTAAGGIVRRHIPPARFRRGFFLFLLVLGVVLVLQTALKSGWI